MERKFRNADPIIDVVEDSAHDMRNYIISRMTDTPRQDTGYKRGNKMHYPSRIHNFPARDSGELVRSIRVERRGLRVELGSKTGAPYSKYLEDLDSQYSEKTRRRFLKPTVEAYSSKLDNKLTKILKRFAI